MSDAERGARLYVLPDRWDHAIGAALRFARRDGLRYQVRWFPPRGCWVVSRASDQTRVIPPGTTGGAA